MTGEDSDGGGDPEPSIAGTDDEPTVPGEEPTVPGETEPAGAGADGRRIDGQEPRDPAGVGDEPAGADSGLTGQPDAEEFESATDWSDVDETTDDSPDSTGLAATQPAVDAGPQGPASNTGPNDGAQGVSSSGQGTQAGPATGGHGGGTQAGTAQDSDTTRGAQRGPGEKFCSNCGSVISEQAVVCPDCGVEQPSAQGAGAQGAGSGSDPAVAALLSAIGLLIPIASGAGQLYNGDVGKAVLFTIIQLINVGLIFLLVGIFTYPLVAIIAIWDAYSSADG